VRVRFWGTRGSVASAGSHTIRYGGNTACVSVTADDGTRVVLDCGTGARPLGAALLDDDPTRPIALFITHTHWDHIQGFPFFAPAYAAGATITVYGGPGLERTTEAALVGQMEHTYFPVHLRKLRAALRFQELGEGSLDIGPFQAHAQYVNHTALALAYRLEAGGARVVYATDHEPFWRHEPLASLESSLAHPGDARHAEFLRDADLLIHDAQYTDAELPAKRGWGHSPIEYAVDLACLARVKRLALFHHDPARHDHDVTAMLRRAHQRARRHGASLEIFAAREGMDLVLPESPRTLPAPADPAPEPARRGGRGVLLASDAPRELDLLQATLGRDGYHLFLAQGLDDALRRACAPDIQLAVVGLRDANPRGARVVDALQRGPAGAPRPVIAIADARDWTPARWPGTGAVDLLARPWAPGMLRARVGIWLARSAALAD